MLIRVEGETSKPFVLGEAVAQFKKFLVTIDKTVPEGLQIYLVCDNCEDQGRTASDRV